MNHTYGYRTAAAFRSQAEWDEAQRFSAKVMMGAALLIIVGQVLAIATTKPPVALIVSVLLLVLAVLAVVPITEAHLRTTFDSHGNRIVSVTDRK